MILEPVLVLLLTGAAGNAEKARDPERTVPLSPVPLVEDRFTLPGGGVHVTPRGRVVADDGSSDDLLGEAATVSGLWAATTKDRFLIVYRAEDAETAWGGIGCIAADRGRILWRRSIPGLAGPAIVAEGAVFVSGYQALSRLDLATGDVVWSLQLDAPQDEDPSVVRLEKFNDTLVATLAGSRRTVVIDARSGEVSR